MSLHDKQKFSVDGVEWQFRKGETPQGTLHGQNAQNRTSVAIQAKDWSKPMWEGENAVLKTRSTGGNQWDTHKAQSLQNAVKMGTNHIKELNQDREIAKMEHQLKSGQSQGVQAKKQNPKLSQQRDKGFLGFISTGHKGKGLGDDGMGQ